MARRSIILILLALVSPLATPLAYSFDGTNQMNLNLGMDMPSEGATYQGSAGLLKFQLQTPPKVFRFLTSFTAAMGSTRRMGEFGAGFGLYFMGKFLEETRMEPFVGAEGIGAFGELGGKLTLTGGFGIFTGVDLRIFGKKSGMTLAIEYTQVQQQSLRFWLGIFFLKL